MVGSPKATTTDALYDGAVNLRQPVSGYRVNVDAPILADFAAFGPRTPVAIDLGAGVGSVALGLHHLAAAAHFELVEREAALVELAAENARHARMSHRTWCFDLGDGLPDALRQNADLVVSNPPFFDPANTRQGNDAAKTRARFGELGPFLRAAAAAVRGARARVAFIYPARELSRFLGEAADAQLMPKRLRLVHSDAQSAARVALIELRRARPGGLVILPPLIEWESKGVRSPELVRILAGKPLSAEETAGDRK
jgi:tRNA1Val (adenine37-N6)-methyltransferase